MYFCWQCKQTNQFVNQCGCDKNNLPTSPRQYRCQKCGVVKPDVKKTADPYESDVNGIVVEGRWCKKCLDEIAADI